MSADDDDLETAFFDAVVANLRTLGFQPAAADAVLRKIAEAAETAGGTFLFGFQLPDGEDVLTIDSFVELFEASEK